MLLHEVRGNRAFADGRYTLPDVSVSVSDNVVHDAGDLLRAQNSRQQFFDMGRTTDQVRSIGEVRCELLNQLLDLGRGDGPKLSSRFGDKTNLLLAEVPEDPARSRLSHSKEECCDALRSFQNLRAICLHG